MPGQDVLSVNQVEMTARSVSHLKLIYSCNLIFSVCDLLIYFMTILFICFT